jgi:26S proteasome regulatory subunit N2
MYGRMEEADALVESLCRDKDPILRWSGMYTIGMAYCGSGNNQAIRKLLHVAVSISYDIYIQFICSLRFSVVNLAADISFVCVPVRP